MSQLIVGIDIGGTFTDLVALDQRGNRYFGKALTTYPDPSEGFLTVLNEWLNKYHFSLSDITRLIHGTTLVVNALIERKGAKTALLTTEGFRDSIEIGTEGRPDVYDLFANKAEPLVPRYLRVPIKERILADGTEYTPLNEQDVREKVRNLIEEEKIDALAVSFLHSYLNNKHESRVKEICKDMFPNLRVSLSSEVCPEIREYQRTTTTVANVYVQPIVEEYLHRLDSILLKEGFKGQFHMMLSGGGTCTIETACKFPIRILESGPIGGAMASVFYSRLCDFSRLLVFDMGGTTAKASLIEDGNPLLTNGFEVARAHRFTKGSGIPVKIPVIEMIEIGAGGGSIAHIDKLGLMQIGPESASSVPGPVCYDKGGDCPTVTDADLVLGYLNPDYFLGGEMKLNIESARKVIEKKVAKPLGISIEEAAWGIHHLVNENMASAARIHSAERGKNINEFSLFATGGAGPVHVCNLASILDVPTIISPIGAGVGSAFGFLSTPLAFDFVRSYHKALDELDWEHVNQLFEEMEEEGRKLLMASDIDPKDMKIIRSCDMRYVGQSYEIRAQIPNGRLDESSKESIINQFEDEYRKLYVGVHKEMPIDMLNWRIVVQGPEPKISLILNQQHESSSLQLKGKRSVYFDEFGKYVPTPVYERSSLLPNTEFAGPAIIEERESTLVVNSEYDVHVDNYLNIILYRKKDADTGPIY
ncbi:hydantoinase/oxoprolinase family protein [Sporolactobacillus sp. THM7-4]|nr:hydantoinase/oxoprolinase family protein [Sporolactobacillus sp. THM7-4]